MLNVSKALLLLLLLFITLHHSPRPLVSGWDECSTPLGPPPDREGEPGRWVGLAVVI